MSSAASTKKVNGCRLYPPSSFNNPSSLAMSTYVFFSFWKKPYFLSEIFEEGFTGSDSLGYFTKVPRVA